MTNEQIQELKGNQVRDPYYLVECGNCAEIYPSNKLAGGGQIADTGDYGSCYCPHCDAGDEYEDLGNSAAEAWNYPQKKIDALLAAREEDKALIAEQAKRIAKLERALDLARNSNSVLAIRSELEVREEDNQFLVVRHPGKSPVIKRPSGELAEFLSQIMKSDPLVTIDIVTHRYYGTGGQFVQDADEYLATAGITLVVGGE